MERMVGEGKRSAKTKKLEGWGEKGWGRRGGGTMTCERNAREGKMSVAVKYGAQAGAGQSLGSRKGMDYGQKGTGKKNAPRKGERIIGETFFPERMMRQTGGGVSGRTSHNSWSLSRAAGIDQHLTSSSKGSGLPSLVVVARVVLLVLSLSST